MAHFCKNCGLLTAPYDERCPKCGAPLPHIPLGETLSAAMRQSPEGTVETGEPLYEQNLEEDRIDAMSQGATTAAMLLFAIPIAGFVLAVVWSFGGTQDPARRRLARAYLIRALVVAGLVILFVAVAAMVFTAALHSQLAYYYYRSGGAMKASVIIPNLNGAGWLRDSIESVWAQTEQDFELIVIDNGSTDESLDIARSYCGRDRYTLIENAGNTGFSHAVNQGIAIAKGEYMALFNNDAFAEPDWLAELIKTADADPKIFAVSSLMLRYYEPELADDAGDYVTILGFACKRGDGLKASRYTKPCRVFSACGGAALYRKSILDEIGVFDELFFAYYEDVDLSWRANNFGYRNVYCPTARCRHICGATTGAVRYNPFKSIQSGRNSILLPYKNQPLLMLVLNFIPMLLGYLLKVLMFRLRGFGGDYAKGFREAWAALPKINKPKFKWRNLPNYVWVEFSLIAGLFKYIVYRVQRALKIT